ELEIIDQTLTTAIADRRDQLNAELNQLEALEQALAVGQPIGPRRTTSLGEAGDHAATKREAAIARVCEQLYYARHALADPSDHPRRVSEGRERQSQAHLPGGQV